MDTTDSGAQEDQIADEMLHFMEKLPPEFITGGDLSTMDFSGNTLGIIAATAPPPTLQKPNNPFDHSAPPPFPPSSCGAHYYPLTINGNGNGKETTRSSMAAMREMIFRIAAMQPVHIDPESVRPPKRRNVKISRDPQSVAARHRRERISQKIRILQRLVPGGTKMDTASMLDEAIHYVKFLKSQVQSLESAAVNRPASAGGAGFPVVLSAGGGCFPVMHTHHDGFQQHCYDP